MAAVALGVAWGPSLVLEDNHMSVAVGDMKTVLACHSYAEVPVVDEGHM